MNKLTSIVCLGFALVMGGCSSHNNSSAQTPAQAQKIAADTQNLPQVKNKPVTADTRFAAGQIAESRNKIDEAMHQYECALEIDPNHLPSLYHEGLIYTAAKRFDKAIPIFQRYVKASGNAGAAYGNLGFCYELAGNSKLAIDAYQKGIDKDSKNVPCRTNYGLLLARQGKITEAVRMWNPVLPEADIHYNLASIYDSNGRKLEATAEYQKALDLDPTQNDARDRLAQLQLNQ